jgi:bifunctional lysine-specific demethylase and histidyl-hydroxylase NO66
MTRRPALERCVGDKDAFLDKHWGAEPLYRPALDGSTFGDLIDVAGIDRLISTLAHHPDVNLVKDGAQIRPSEFTSPPDPRRGGAPVIDPGRVYDLFHAGATIQMQGVHYRFAPLAEFCRELELELAVPVQANMYITPPGSRGLGLHYDSHDVMVLQLVGHKSWQLFDPMPGAPPAIDDEVELASTPLRLAVELAVGDVLYFPRGFPHRVEATTSASVHLTVGFVALTWLDVLRQAMVTAERDPGINVALPLGFAHGGAAAVTAVEASLRGLASWLGSLDSTAVAEAVSRRFWSQCTPVLDGQLAQLIALPDLVGPSVVARRPASICRLGDDADGVVTISMGDRQLELPARLRPAIDYIMEHPRFVVDDLDPFLDPESRLVLVRRLIREGLLVQSS